MRVCRPGVTYTAAADLNPLNGKCPTNGTSSSAEASAQLLAVADGSRAEGDIAVGVGVAEWQVFGTAELHARVRPRRALPPRDPGRHQRLGRAVRSPTTSCPGADVRHRRPDRRVRQPHPAAVSTAGSDRMQAAWAGATLAQCGAGAGAGASSSFAPTGEGEALEAFAAGQRDLAYTACGYRPVAGLDPATERGGLHARGDERGRHRRDRRQQVTTDDPPGRSACRSRTAQPIRMTAAEAATLVGQGPFQFADVFGPDFLARNPQLGTSPYWRRAATSTPEPSPSRARRRSRCSRSRSSTAWPPSRGSPVPARGTSTGG